MEELPSGGPHPVYLGIDVGSTSTKAVVTDMDGQVAAGFYTATAGRPLEAAQLILEAVDDWKSRKGLDLLIAGAATTGAGRKFIGRILGADLILDEITAHARAAVELHPEVDTILEIGGQDSKFTTLKDGQVICHWHGWCFDLETGQGDRRAKEWLRVDVYEVRVEGEDVYVRRPDEPPPEDGSGDGGGDDDWVAWSDEFLK